MTDIESIRHSTSSFDKECRWIASAAIALRTREPAIAVEVSHIDNFPGAAMYVRDANRIACRVPSGGAALDWGCGFGQMAYLLANRGFRVSACDWGARPRLPELVDDRIRYFSLDHPTRIAAEDKSFDMVLSSGTLEHAQNIVGSLQEIHRILKPGGWFCVFRFPNEWSISEWIARRSGRWSHAVRFSKSDLQFLLRMFGFRVLEMGFDSFLPIFFGRRLQLLRPLREKLDVPVTILDQLLTHTPLVSRFSTSIRCLAQMNDEYQDIIENSVG